VLAVATGVHANAFLPANTIVVPLLLQQPILSREYSRRDGDGGYLSSSSCSSAGGLFRVLALLAMVVAGIHREDSYLLVPGASSDVVEALLYVRLRTQPWNRFSDDEIVEKGRGWEEGRVLNPPHQLGFPKSDFRAHHNLANTS